MVFIFGCTNKLDKRMAMKATLTNVSVYCKSSSSTMAYNEQWPPGIMFFGEKYPSAMAKYIMVILPARIVCRQAKNWGLPYILAKFGVRSKSLARIFIRSGSDSWEIVIFSSGWLQRYSSASRVSLRVHDECWTASVLKFCPSTAVRIYSKLLATERQLQVTVD